MKLPMRLPQNFLQSKPRRRIPRKYPPSNTRSLCQFTGCVHAAAFVTYLIITLAQDNGSITIPRLKTPVTRNIATWVNASEQAIINTTSISGHLDLKQCPLAASPPAKDSTFVVQQLVFDANGYEIDTRILIIVFHLLSAFFQIPLGFSHNYSHQLDRGIANYSHFVEYSISASVLLLAVAAQAMITDIFLLTSLAANCTGCMIMGLLAEVLFQYEAGFSTKYEFTSEHDTLVDDEKINTDAGKGQDTTDYDKKSISAYWVAHFTGWLLITIAMISANSSLISLTICAGDYAKRPPWFIPYLVGGEIFLFMCFGLVQTYSFIARNSADTIDDEGERKRRKSEVAYQAEFCYILLSATAKLFLGCFVFVGNYTNK